MIHLSFYKKFTTIIAVSIAMTTSAWASGLLLYAPFEKSAVPTISNGVAKPMYNENVEIEKGKFGNAASLVGNKSGLVFDGPGNVYSAAGTISFFWRLDADPAGRSVTILNLTPLGKTDDGRYISLSYAAGKFKLYVSAGEPSGQTFTSPSVLVIPGRWHHLALCWNRSLGLTFYVDGQTAFQSNNTWMYDDNIGGIGLGVSGRAGQPSLAAFSQSYDEFRVYDRWLDDPALRLLKAGKAAKPSPLDATSLGNQRSKQNHWNVANAAKLPQLKVGIGGGIGLRQANIESSPSADTADNTLFDGNWATGWPSDGKTKSIAIAMQKKQPFDVVQILGEGNLKLVDTDAKNTVLDFSAAYKSFRDYVLQAPVLARHLSLQAMPPNSTEQPSSAAFEINLFKQIRYHFELDKSWQTLSLHPSTDKDQSLDALLHIRQAFYTSDQQTVMAQKGDIKGQITAPAMHTFHIVGPAHAQDRELDAVDVELKLLPGTPSYLRVQLMDPRNPLHFITSVDVHLNGGPGMLRLLLDHRDIILPSGARPVISLTFSEDAAIDLSGSSVHYQWKNVGK